MGSNKPALETESRGLASLVRGRIGSLTASERKVARAFLTSYPIAGLENVAQLAQRAGVSGPTVMRFIGKLGFEGYPEFQEALRHEVQEKLTSALAQFPEESREAPGGLLRAALQAFHTELDRSYAALSQVELDEVVDLLADPRCSILCTGGRFSQVAAYYLFLHMNMLRPKCRYVMAAPTPRWDELIDVDRRTVLVVFDYRRYQNSTIEFARRAVQRGCQIVLFTDPWLSPVAEVSRYVLTSSVQAPSPFDTMVPAFALLETVVAGLSVRIGAKAKPRIAELERLRAGTTWGEVGLEVE
jgi:DNA-binding MurR/RpiR family transcriptional regulator